MTERPSSDEAIRRAYEAICLQVEQAALQAGRNPQDIQIMAVTKTMPPQLINAAIQAGVTLLGENRAQELVEKYPDYQLGSCGIHFIGTLQTNKVRQIIDKVDMIQSVSSVRLAKEIDRLCQLQGRVMPILLQVNIGREATKGGFLPEEMPQALEEIDQLPGVVIQGLMAIPPYSQNKAESEGYFAAMHQMSVDIKDKKLDNGTIAHLSMGMSSDYTAAIKHGATIIRVGTALFGTRSY